MEENDFLQSQVTAHLPFLSAVALLGRSMTKKRCTSSGTIGLIFVRSGETFVKVSTLNFPTARETVSRGFSANTIASSKRRNAQHCESKDAGAARVMEWGNQAITCPRTVSFVGRKSGIRGWGPQTVPGKSWATERPLRPLAALFKEWCSVFRNIPLFWKSTAVPSYDTQKPTYPSEHAHSLACTTPPSLRLYLDRSGYREVSPFCQH